LGSAGRIVIVKGVLMLATSGAWISAFFRGVVSNAEITKMRKTYKKRAGVRQVRVDLEDGIGIIRIVQTEEVRTKVDGNSILNWGTVRETFSLDQG
jgi:hypothetical protein